MAGTGLRGSSNCDPETISYDTETDGITTGKTSVVFACGDRLIMATSQYPYSTDTFVSAKTTTIITTTRYDNTVQNYTYVVQDLPPSSWEDGSHNGAPREAYQMVPVPVDYRCPSQQQYCNRQIQATTTHEFFGLGPYSYTTQVAYPSIP